MKEKGHGFPNMHFVCHNRGPALSFYNPLHISMPWFRLKQLISMCWYRKRDRGWLARPRPQRFKSIHIYSNSVILGPCLQDANICQWCIVLHCAPCADPLQSDSQSKLHHITSTSNKSKQMAARPVTCHGICASWRAEPG